MRPIFYCLSLAVIVTIMGLGFATAQGDRGTIAGTVKDSSGAVLPGARVELQQKGPSAVSDAQGQFIISNLPAGSYTVEVSYVGFSPFLTTANVVAGQIAHVDAPLKVETTTHSTTVTSDPRLV